MKKRIRQLIGEEVFPSNLDIAYANEWARGETAYEGLRNTYRAIPIQHYDLSVISDRRCGRLHPLADHLLRLRLDIHRQRPGHRCPLPGDRRADGGGAEQHVEAVGCREARSQKKRPPHGE